jgi:hypothetical protein
VRIRLKNTVLGEDDQIYTPGSVIEVEDNRAKFLVGMGDAEKAGDKDEISPPPPPPPSRSSIEERAIKAAVHEAINKPSKHDDPRDHKDHKK